MPIREQFAQGRDLVTAQRVDRWLAVLEAPNVVVALAYTKRWLPTAARVEHGPEDLQ